MKSSGVNETRSRTVRTLLLTVVLLSVAASLPSLQRRHRVESANRTVAIAVDWDEVRTLAASAGEGEGDPDTVLRSLKEAGVTAVAVTEPVLEDLLRAGRASFRGVSGPAAKVYRLSSPEPDVERAIARALQTNGLSVPPSLEEGRPGLTARVDPSILARLPLGFGVLREDISLLQTRHGLEVIARACNFPAYSQEGMEAVAAEARRLGMSTVIFAGDEVLGWRGSVEDCARVLEETNLTFGSIEFGKQKGSDRLEKALDGGFLRVHSISATEMAQYQPAAAAERFVRAARERGIRILYVRLVTLNGPDAVQANADYIADIAAGLRRSGLQTGAPEVIADVRPGAWERALMAAGVAAAGTLALCELVRLTPGAAAAWLLALSLVLVPVSLAGDLGRKAAALAAALAFPVWAAARAARLASASAPEQTPDTARIPAHYLNAITLAVLGGLLIAALLTGRLFMLHTEGFAGVKAAHLLPVLAVALWAGAGLLGCALPWRETVLTARGTFRRIWASPVLFSTAIVGLIGLAALLAVVIRSGNEAGIGVSPLELRFRALLDQVLYVRPRTKEILLGYPALWTGLWLFRKGETGWARLFTAAGVIGLVSAVNTFCHIHTPLTVSLVRTFNGVWVGAVGGMILVALLRACGLGRSVRS